MKKIQIFFVKMYMGFKFSFFSPTDMNFLFLRFKLIMNTYKDYAYSNFTWLQSFSTLTHSPKLK